MVLRESQPRKETVRHLAEGLAVAFEYSVTESNHDDSFTVLRDTELDGVNESI